jgi:hypothetical protein
MTIPEVKRTFRRGGQVKLATASTFYATLEEFNKGRTHKERTALASKCLPINVPHKKLKPVITQQQSESVAAVLTDPPVDLG